MATNKTQATIETLQAKVATLKETSKIIRYVYGETTGDHRVAQVERLLKQLGVTTKNGDPIRYQHVRNVLTQNMGTKL
jgi:hypothetical protein